jgi:hypothetical protein
MPDKSDRKFAFEVERVRRTNYQAKTGSKPHSLKEAQRTPSADHADDWCDENYVVIANYWRMTETEPHLPHVGWADREGPPKEYIAQIAQSQRRSATWRWCPRGPPQMLPPAAGDPTVKSRARVGESPRSSGSDRWHARPLQGRVGRQIHPARLHDLRADEDRRQVATKGMTFDAQDLTKANNYLLSAQIENIALTPKQPFIGPKGAFESDKAKWNNVNTGSIPTSNTTWSTSEGKPLPPPQRSPGVTAQPEIANVRLGVVWMDRAP